MFVEFIEIGFRIGFKSSYSFNNNICIYIHIIIYFREKKKGKGGQICVSFEDAILNYD